MTEAQGELFALEPPVPGSSRCELPLVMGSSRRCPRPAVGTVPDWTAPLDLLMATPACEDCAKLYRAELDRWLL